MFRIENLNDDVFAFPKYVDMYGLVEPLWQYVNGDEKYDYDLTETSVTGNMPISEMEARRLKWKTGTEDQEKELSDYSLVKLESMRIRVFVVEYKPKKTNS